jgi:uncharacterized protein
MVTGFHLADFPSPAESMQLVGSWRPAHICVIRSTKIQLNIERIKMSQTSEPWYRDGLRFKCTGCGDCCTGAPGYVWVNQIEIENLAATVGVSVEEFEDLYTRKIGIRRSLKEFPNGSCVFFDEEKRNCQVYLARPRQCKSWPFWDSNVKNEEAWQATCDVCPGSGNGKLYKLEHIETQRASIKL